MFGAIVTLATLLPAPVGVRADPQAPTPPGIRPEWYFLFMFQTLKHVPEAVGVLFFALVTAFLVLMPFLDRAAAQGRESRWLTAVLVALFVYAGIFQTIAELAPGVKVPPEEMVPESYSRAGGLVWLCFMWLVIGFLVYYLRKLAQLNTRVRLMYRRS
jgi:quinol-cytochrome oxidoreductase complex cytochrome b subunit